MRQRHGRDDDADAQSESRERLTSRSRLTSSSLKAKSFSSLSECWCLMSASFDTSLSLEPLGKSCFLDVDRCAVMAAAPKAISPALSDHKKRRRRPSRRVTMSASDNAGDASSSRSGRFDSAISVLQKRGSG